MMIAQVMVVLLMILGRSKKKEWRTEDDGRRNDRSKSFACAVCVCIFFSWKTFLFLDGVFFGGERNNTLVRVSSPDLTKPSDERTPDGFVPAA